MSRIGKAPISIPQGVTITIKENIVTVKGKLGELTQVVKDVAVKQEDGQLIVERQLDTKQGNALHGLYRALLHNMAKVPAPMEHYRNTSGQPHEKPL